MKHSKINLIITLQLGWAFWRAVFPYLLEDASFEASIKTYLLTLKPVVAKPWIFFANFSLLNDCFAIFENPLAWILSALTPGINPPYPGIATFFG